MGFSYSNLLCNLPTLPAGLLNLSMEAKIKLPPYFLALLIPLLAVNTTHGQDPVFSQFYASPLHLNPAFAGVTLAPRITLNYRNQWAALSGGFKTYAATYEQSIESLNSGIGFHIMTDNAMQGVYRTNRFNAVYSYQLQVSSEFFIKMGVEAGLIQATLDWDRLRFGDQIDPLNGFYDASGNLNSTEEIQPDNLTTTIPDISIGMLAYGSSFYFGFSAKHLNQPDESILQINPNLNSGLPMRFSLHGGVDIPLIRGNNRNIPVFVSPNVLFLKQGDFGQINAGAFAGFGPVYGGLWYRHTFSNPDAAIALIGYKYEAFRIGYSYDVTLSSLALTNTGGTHEISLSINFDDSSSAKRRKKSSQYLDCFKMFR